MDHALNDVRPTTLLTGRELQILRLMAEDLSFQAMADQLEISATTLKWHTQRIYDKLGFHGNRPKRLLATSWAHRAGLLESEKTSGRTSRSRLPTPATPFIGRADELRNIPVLLADPEVRLVSLTGPGGIGKTRLAIRIAMQLEDQFLNGVGFADLQPLQSAAYLPTAIATAAGIALAGQEEPAQQLLRQLRDRHMLLVIDNFEHLLDGTGLLTRILQEAPDVKLLVTSRQPLNLRAEWRWAMHGLSYPAPGAEGSDASDAVLLFEARARPARPDFSLAHELPHVVRICQMVEGMPLALELAASWLHALPCAQVAEEIERSLHFLTTNLRDLPDRHRSMWAVFEQSWAQLSDEERDGFVRLSVFRGGFLRDAAAEVAGVSLPMLAQLVERGLLYRTATGRYRMQELVRQYAAERLTDVRGRADAAHDRHCTYYLGFVQAQEADLKGAGMPEALQQIADELDNIRAAWKWAIQARRLADIDAALFGLAYFYYVRSMNHEAVSALEAFRAVLPEEDSMPAGRALMWEAACLLHYGHITTANERAQRGIRILRDHRVSGDIAPPMEIIASTMHLAGGSAVEFKDYAERILGESVHNRGDFSTAYALLTLRHLAAYEDEPELVRHYDRESLHASQALGHPWCMTMALLPISDVAVDERRYEDARQTLDEIAHLGEQMGDPVTQTIVDMKHAELNMLQGRHSEAARWLESHITHNDTFNPLCPSPIHALNLLAKIAITTGDHAAARLHLRTAARRLVDGEYPSVMMARCLTMAAPTLEDLSMSAWAVSAAALAHYLLAGERERMGVPDVLVRSRQELPADEWEAAWARGEAMEPAAFAAALFEELSKEQPETALATMRQHRHGRYQSVIELSERELQILRLVAEGRSNREIADALVVTVGTVKKHLNNVFSKLGAHSRTQAIVCARESGVLV